MGDSELSKPKGVAKWVKSKVVGAAAVVNGSTAAVSGAASAIFELPEDPLEQAILYRRYALQFPYNVRLGLVAWSAGLVFLAAPGVKTRLLRTAFTGLALTLFLVPELLKR